MSSGLDVGKQGLTRLANDAWESLLLAHTTLMRRFADDDIWEDVSMREYDVLYTLSKCSAPIRLRELERHVLLSQPALSRMVDRLVSRNLVRRETDPSDARGVGLSLTEAGSATQRQIGRRHARSVTSAMTEALARSELAELRDLCVRLATHDDAGEAEPRE